MVREFKNWLSGVKKAKCQRNSYVHGRWSVVFFKKCKNIRFESQFGSKGSMEEFILDGFTSMVEDMKGLLNEFHKLREKYLDQYSFGRSLSNVNSD